MPAVSRERETIAPTTIPTIAPADRPTFSIAGCGVEDVDGVANIEFRSVLNVDEALLRDVIDELPIRRLDDAAMTAPPNFCGRVIIPMPELQHALLSPQHQRSLSAPAQDVMRVKPLGLRVCSQTLRQAPDVKLLEVQKSAKKLNVFSISPIHNS
jgi:hypothetical protein